MERLLQDRGFAAVVLSDADAVWLRDARPLLDAHPTADVFVSTDCLSHQVHLCGAPVLLFVPRHGHVYVSRLLMDAHPTADAFVSTDCLSHRVRASKPYRKIWNRVRR